MVAPAAPSVARPPAAGGSRAPLVSTAVAVLAAVGTWGVWRFFVTTRYGQQLDEAAFEGAELGQSRLLVVAEPVLSVISIPFIGLVLVAAMLLAVVRRRVLQAVQVAVLVGGANLSTQLLKRVLWDRPDLDVGFALDNALPSGHTTAAASVSAALLYVVPRGWRPVAAVLGVVYTCATGMSTLVDQWHRPSDVVAGVLVVVAWSGIVGAFGGPTPAVVPAGVVRATSLTAGALLLGGLAAALGAVLALQRTTAVLDTGPEGRAELFTAYLGGALGVVAVTALAFGVLLLLRATGAVPRTADAGSPTATVDLRS